MSDPKFNYCFVTETRQWVHSRPTVDLTWAVNEAPYLFIKPCGCRFKYEVLEVNHDSGEAEMKGGPCVCGHTVTVLIQEEPNSG